jgi:hypothetical protein
MAAKEPPIALRALPQRVEEGVWSQSMFCV